MEENRGSGESGSVWIAISEKSGEPHRDGDNGRTWVGGYDGHVCEEGDIECKDS